MVEIKKIAKDDIKKGDIKTFKDNITLIYSMFIKYIK